MEVTENSINYFSQEKRTIRQHKSLIKMGNSSSNVEPAVEDNEVAQTVGINLVPNLLKITCFKI